MNERIDQLLVKAGAYFGAEGVNYASFEPKKFAELILADCRDMFVVNSPSWNLLNEKLEHFGVEE